MNDRRDGQASDAPERDVSGHGGRETEGAPPPLQRDKQPRADTQPTEPVASRAGYTEMAERSAEERLAEEQERIEGIEEGSQPYVGPPPEANLTLGGGSQIIDAGQTADGNQTPPAPRVGGTPYGGDAGEGEQQQRPPNTVVTPEGTEPIGEGSPGEKRRRKATH